MFRKTRIIATVGPASEDKATLKKLILKGVNVFRINLSHGELNHHKKVIKTIDTVRKSMKASVGIMLDTRGPEVRVKKFENGSVELVKNKIFKFCLGDFLGNDKEVCISEENAVKNAKIGKFIFANDGLIKLKIIEKTDSEIVCKILKGGKLSNNKGLFFAGQTLNLPYLNNRDMVDLEALKDDIDFIAGSFVTSKEDVNELKKIAPNAKIIAKIENADGVSNIDEILKISDGIMVARGDLGVELSYEKVPSIQKILIEKAKNSGKTVIVATEMLESMITENRPTRAEVSDVATAIYDNACAIMLSAETAVGKNPVECVKVFDLISKNIEKNIDYKEIYFNQNFPIESDFDLICQSAVNASLFKDIKAIVVATSTGKSAHKLCKFSTNTPIVAITDNKKTFNELSLLRNCIPVFQIEKFSFNNACEIVKNLKIAKENQQILLVTGTSDEISNCMKLQTI